MSARALLPALLIAACGLPATAHAADLQATPATLDGVFAAANGGDVIHLAAGAYGTFSVTDVTKAQPVTLEAARGAVASIAPQLVNVDGLRFQHLVIGKTDVAGSRNLAFDRNRFVGMTRVDTPATITDAAISFTENHFDDINTCDTCFEGRLTINGDGNTAPVGVTIARNHFGNTTAGMSDGIQVIGKAYGVQILDNEFEGINQAPFDVHVDPIQLFGSSHTLIRGNFFRGNSTGIMAGDGTDQERIENNLFVPLADGTGYPWPVNIGGDAGELGSVVQHNTLVSGMCEFGLENPCGTVRVGSDNNGVPSFGTTIIDNVVGGVAIGSPSETSSSVAYEDFNLVGDNSALGENDISASPVFAGALPSSWSDYLLAPGSRGTGAATDGIDMGISGSGPPHLSSPPRCADLSLAAVHSGATRTGDPRCADDDGDPLAYSVAPGQGPAHGTVTVDPVSGGLSYKAAGSYAGPDTFQVLADDETGEAPATATVSVDVVDAAPVCQPVALGDVLQGAVTSKPAACTDADASDTLTYRVESAAAHGTAAIDGGAVKYTAPAGYHGPDSFTYVASDGVKDSAPATVSVTVANARPTCKDLDLGAVLANGSVSKPADCADADATDSLAYRIVTAPAHGTAAIDGGAVKYTAGAGYKGADSFTYVANDGIDDSAPATVSVDVVDARPVCQDVALSDVLRGAATSKPAACTDADASDTLTYRVESAAAHGTAAIDGGAVKYTAAPGYVGNDSFTYVASDGVKDSAPATVSVTVADARPTCKGLDLGTVLANASASKPADCADADAADTLAFRIVTGPAHGTATVVGDALKYTAGAGYKGADSFTYVAGDGIEDSAPATVHVDVGDARPTCQDIDLGSVLRGAAASKPAACTDADVSDTLTSRVVTAPAHGTAAIDAGAVKYTAAPGYIGKDSFTYVANDGSEDSVPATVAVEVVDAQPVCQDVDLGAVLAGSAASKGPNCSDEDASDTLAYRILTPPGHGTAGMTSGELRYAAPAAYHGSVTFTYVASDGHRDSAPATVTVRVDQNPIVGLTADHDAAQRGATLHFTASASDPDGGSITDYRFSVDGALVRSGTSPVLARRFDSTGTHTVAVKVTDDDGHTAVASRTVRITPEPEITPTPTPTVTPPPDETPPTLTLTLRAQRIRGVLGKGVAITVSTDEPCTIALQAVLSRGVARQLGLGKRALAAGKLSGPVAAGESTLKLKLAAKVRKALKRHPGRYTLTLRVVGTDAAGNAGTPVTANLKLKK